jgi:hypothetical protein
VFGELFLELVEFRIQPGPMEMQSLDIRLALVQTALGRMSSWAIAPDTV